MYNAHAVGIAAETVQLQLRSTASRSRAPTTSTLRLLAFISAVVQLRGRLSGRQVPGRQRIPSDDSLERRAAERRIKEGRQAVQTQAMGSEIRRPRGEGRRGAYGM